MKYLVGDIGNTMTKVSLLNDNFKIISSSNIQTKKIYDKVFLNFFTKKYLKKDLNNKALFSSVVPKAFNSFKFHLKKKKNKTSRN